MKQGKLNKSFIYLWIAPVFSNHWYSYIYVYVILLYYRRICDILYICDVCDMQPIDMWYLIVQVQSTTRLYTDQKRDFSRTISPPSIWCDIYISKHVSKSSICRRTDFSKIVSVLCLSSSFHIISRHFKKCWSFRNSACFEKRMLKACKFQDEFELPSMMD